MSTGPAGLVSRATRRSPSAAAGVRLRAVVGLLAASVDLLLVGLLRHGVRLLLPCCDGGPDVGCGVGARGHRPYPEGRPSTQASRSSTDAALITRSAPAPSAATLAHP